MRRGADPERALRDLLEAVPGLTHRATTCPAPDGWELAVSVFRRRDDDRPGPGILWIHGGGMIAGERNDGVLPYLRLLAEHGGAVVTVDYRLAPEHPAPVPVRDCHAAFAWVHAHAAELGVDRVVLAGGSAGGGLAAGVALLARDRGEPVPAGVLLECPMLDDRNDTRSTRQFETAATWSGRSNEFGWTALLGERAGRGDVSPYDAPARSTWLGGLPPVHLSVGSADPFRDEDVAFAAGIWRDGGDCELLIVPGGVHGFEHLVPEAQVSRTVMASRSSWYARLLDPDTAAVGERGLPGLVAHLTGERVDVAGARRVLGARAEAG
ncbi:alpha/beta hydrolase [Cellulomonas hominis]|nr:alpha/beta hydrolase [Cellulomonas hominis]NKY10425.1 alpha/beta hydrolase [Cellulomonas hominis]